MIVGVILYGAAVLISLLCILFQNAVFDFMNGYAVDLCLDRPVFPLIAVYQIIILLMLATFLLVMHKYRGTHKRVAGIVMIVVYCAFAIMEPYIYLAEDWVAAIFRGENELTAIVHLSTYLVTFTLPFTTVSAVLAFMAIGRYGVTGKNLVNPDGKPNGKMKIPMIVAVILYGIVLLSDILIVIYQQAVYHLWERNWFYPTISVFPSTAIIHIIFIVMYIIFLLIMFNYRGSANRKAGIAMIVIYCLMPVAVMLINYNYGSVLLSSGVNYWEASFILEKNMSLIDSPFITVSAVFLFIAVGRFGIIKRENNENSDI